MTLSIGGGESVIGVGKCETGGRVHGQKGYGGGRGVGR